MIIIADAMFIILQWICYPPFSDDCYFCLCDFTRTWFICSVGDFYSIWPNPAIWVSIGHTVGDIIYVALAMLALNALAEVINESMLYVKILGASYLIFIGYQQFRSKGISFEPSSKKSSVIKLLIAGFVVGVTNPKTIIFYLSFLPIFIDLNNLTLNTEVQVIVAIGLTVFFVLSLANILGVRLRSYIENPDSIRRINQVTGVTMILVGVFVALY